MKAIRPIAALSLLLLGAPTPAAENAIPAGDHLAQARLAERGLGAPRDYQRAFRLYCLASLAGKPEAYYHLGWAYLNGRGVKRDRGVAVAWFRRGAEAGDRTSANILARLQHVTPRPDPLCPTTRLGKRPDPALVERYVKLLAPAFDLDPKLVLAVIRAESNFNPRARSPKGAVGLMQLMPGTARRFGVKDIHDPLQNLVGGMAYLKWLTGHFDGDLKLVLAGYNAGEEAVRQYKGIPPYAETRGYVSRIIRQYAQSGS